MPSLHGRKHQAPSPVPGGGAFCAPPCYYGVMPSWNVHTAHVQRLFREGSPASFGIRDANAFLFGNYVPDINIGYMVEHPSGILPYRLTHFADPAHIPIPREREFWDTYVEPTLAPADNVPFAPAAITVEESVRLNAQPLDYELPASAERHAQVVAELASPEYRASDVVLGAWAHLLCDHEYNKATHAWLQKYHVEPGEKTRVRKQDDFLFFGRTLPITLTCEATDALLAQAAAFPQYAVCEQDVRASVASATAIVRDNQDNHIEGVPEYTLFTEDFFHEVFEHVTERLAARLGAYARRHGL